MDEIELGEWMRRQRAGKGIAVQTVADELGRSRSTVYTWEQGKSTPTVRDLISWCSAIDVDVRDAIVRVR
jgi:transcriptional regulator with XRE-family HTH domain